MTERERRQRPEYDNHKRLVHAIEFGVGAALFGTALAIVKHRETAEEIVQITYEKALRRMDKFRGDSRIETWLHRIAVNTAFDALRSRNSSEILAGEDVYEEESSDMEADPVGALIKDEELEETVAMIRQLSPNHQKEFLLHMLGFSNQEIAEELGKETTTVKVNIHRARKKLRKIYDQQKTPQEGELSEDN
jgi:RNA polymerase sigma-70 factor (ECF subfamily)